VKYYAVIDTNVLISSIYKEDSIPGRVKNYVYNGILIPLLNEEILEEYKEVLTRNDFNFDENIIKDRLQKIINAAIFLDRTNCEELFTDLDDKVFYEVVLTYRKRNDAYLVTGNIKHFPKKSFVVTPKAMLDILLLNT